MQDNPFAKYAQPQNGPIVAPVDPYKQADEARDVRGEQRDIRGEQRSETQLDLSQRSDARSADSQRFSQIGSLRGEFNKNKAVQEYEAALGSYSSALSTQENASGDQSLIISYAKMLDPGSTVREGEFETTANTTNMIGKIESRLKKEFGWSGGGLLPGEARNFIRQEMKNLVEKRFQPAYSGQRDFYTQLAERNGYDPYEVVGEDAFQRFGPSIRGYWKGQEVGKNVAEFLRDEYGITGDSESELTGWLKGQSGQSSFSAAMLREKYRELGISPMSDEDFEMVAAKVRAGETNFSGIDTSRIVGDYEKQIQERANREEELLGDRGLGDRLQSGSLLGFGDELAGAVGGTIDTITQGGSLSENYRLNRDTERELQRRAGERTGVAGDVVEGLGGVAALPARAGNIFSIGRALGPGNVTRPAVQRALVGQSTREGAAIGALGGFGYGEGAEGSAINALGGAVLGGVAGNLGQRGGNALSNRATSQPNALAARQLADAGQAEGITVNRAMIDQNSNNAVTKADASLIGGRQVQREMGNIEGQLENRVRGLGRGDAPEQEEMGAIVQRAASRATERGGQVAGKLYEKADDMVGGRMIEPRNALAAIDQNIAELEAAGANANAGQIRYLQDIKEDLAKGISIRGLRDQRTGMRGQINERNLGQTDAERRVGLVMDAASKDIAEGLSDAPGALRVYNRADEIWQERGQFRTQIERDLLGPANNPKSGTQTARKLESWAKDDTARFKRMWETLEPAEQDQLSAELAQRLGTNAKGDFSPAIFLNNLWDGKSRIISERTANIVFGKEGAKSLKNLQTIAKEVNRVTSAMNSRTSKSGVASYRDFIYSVIGGGGALFSTGPTTAALTGTGLAGATAAKQAFSAKALMSPKIQRWIRSAPRTTDGAAIDRHYAKLGSIAKAEPALAGEIESLQRAIMGAANDNAVVTQSVASEQDAQEAP